MRNKWKSLLELKHGRRICRDMNHLRRSLNLQEQVAAGRGRASRRAGTNFCYANGIRSVASRKRGISSMGLAAVSQSERSSCDERNTKSTRNGCLSCGYRFSDFERRKVEERIKEAQSDYSRFRLKNLMSKGRAEDYRIDEHGIVWLKDGMYMHQKTRSYEKLILREAHESRYCIHLGSTKM